MNYEKALEAAEFIKSKYDKEIKAAVVLGSGLGAFADEVENAVAIPVILFVASLQRFSK